ADRLVPTDAGLVDPRDQPDAADADLVAGAERTLGPDPLPVHESPVPGAEVADAPSGGNDLEHGVDPGDRPVEREREIVRRGLTDRDPLTHEGNALPGAFEQHLEVVAGVTHGDGNLSRGDGSVARGGWSGVRRGLTIVSTNERRSKMKTTKLHRPVILITAAALVLGLGAVGAV